MERKKYDLLINKLFTNVIFLLPFSSIGIKISALIFLQNSKSENEINVILESYANEIPLHETESLKMSKDSNLNVKISEKLQIYMLYLKSNVTYCMKNSLVIKNNDCKNLTNRT